MFGQAPWLGNGNVDILLDPASGRVVEVPRSAPQAPSIGDMPAREPSLLERMYSSGMVKPPEELGINNPPISLAALLLIIVAGGLLLAANDNDEVSPISFTPGV